MLATAAYQASISTHRSVGPRTAKGVGCSNQQQQHSTARGKATHKRKKKIKTFKDAFCRPVEKLLLLLARDLLSRKGKKFSLASTWMKGKSQQLPVKHSNSNRRSETEPRFRSHRPVTLCSPLFSLRGATTATTATSLLRVAIE